MVSQYPVNNYSFEDSDIFAITGNCNHSRQDHLKRICSTCSDEYVQQEFKYVSIIMFWVSKAFPIDTGSCINVLD
jgi:hypothetical protein